MTSKIVLKIDQKSMKNRPKMDPKSNFFSDCLGDGCRLRFGADLVTILGPMLGRFSDPKSKKNMLKKTCVFRYGPQLGSHGSEILETRFLKALKMNPPLYSRCHI